MYCLFAFACNNLHKKLVRVSEMLSARKLPTILLFTTTIGRTGQLDQKGSAQCAGVQPLTKLSIFRFSIILIFERFCCDRLVYFKLCFVFYNGVVL